MSRTSIRVSVSPTSTVTAVPTWPASADRPLAQWVSIFGFSPAAVGAKGVLKKSENAPSLFLLSWYGSLEMQAIMEPIQNTHRIVQSAQSGDRDAFSTLVEIHRGQVEALARLRMSPGLQRKVGIEDVVQRRPRWLALVSGLAGLVALTSASLIYAYVG